MTDISNRTLSVIISIALIVSLIGLFDLPDGLISVIGHATSDTSYTKINITPTAAINVTQKVIDFGNGTVEPAFAGATCRLTSEDNLTGTGMDPLNCWTGLGASAGLNVVNVGNLQLNVSVTSTKNGSLLSGPVSFWGAVGTNYTWRCTNGNGSSDMATYRAVENISTKCTSYLNATFGQDSFTLHINISFTDSVTGFKNDTLTFTGSAAS